MTSRNTSPNLLLRAQNLKVILRLFELDINASQACFWFMAMFCLDYHSVDRQLFKCSCWVDDPLTFCFNSHLKLSQTSSDWRSQKYFVSFLREAFAMTDRACYSNCSSLNLTTCSILAKEEPDVTEGLKSQKKVFKLSECVQFSMTRMAAIIPRSIWPM